MTQANSDISKPKKSGIAAFMERSALVMFGLGFAAGMPMQLAGAALAPWMRESGMSLSLLALMGLATLTYALKFLWAPVVDRFAIPFLDNKLGRRRSWMFLTQSIVMIGLFMISATDPKEGLVLFGSLAVLIAFAGATQDVAIDAWRIEVADDENDLGILTATYQWGYRIAILLAGALPLFIAQYYNGNIYAHKGWGIAYAVMASFMVIPLLSTLFAPREKAEPAPRWIAPADIPSRPLLETLEWISRLAIMALGACFLAAGLAGKHEPIAWLLSGIYGGAEAMCKSFAAKPWGVWQQVGYAFIGLYLVYITARPIPNLRTKPGAYFHSALGEPLEDFFKRYENVASIILVFICVYRVAEFLLNVTGAMYLDAGFTKADIATAQKFWGAAVSAIGAGLAGWGIIRWGLFRCIIIGAFSQPLSHIPFILICYFGNTHFPAFEAFHIQPVLWTAIGVDNISASFAGTVLVVYMSRLTASGFTATQYALFSSLYALPGKLIASLSGRVVEGAALSAHSGWMNFITPWFTKLPQGSFAAPAAKLGVDPSALAAGYAAFFLYTVAMGIFGVIMAYIIARGKPRDLVEHHV